MESPKASPKVQLIRKYFDLVANFNNDPKEYEQILHKDMVETEYPNLLSPMTRNRSTEEGMKGISMGRRFLKFQKFSIQKVFEAENAVTVEMIWSGEILANIGPLKADQALSAFVCYVFEFKDGLILHQRHYDCFEPI
ncbi:unnamed protein product [Calypogeia fissa]